MTKTNSDQFKEIWEALNFLKNGMKSTIIKQNFQAALLKVFATGKLSPKIQSLYKYIFILLITTVMNPIRK